MLKKNLLAFLGALLSIQPALAGEFLVFPTKLDLLDPEFFQSPHAARPEQDARSDRCDVIFKGQIQKGDLDKLRAIFGYWKDDETHVDGLNRHGHPTLCFDSPGGNITEALAMARYLWNVTDVATRVTSDSKCESACVFPFLTGNFYEEGENQDQYFERVIEAGGKLGLHAPDLNLPSDATYPDTQVSGAFRLALQAAREVYSYGFQTDSDSTPFMGPYMFARFLETPPDEMYHIDTVGDALLSRMPVIGYAANGPADATMVRTICDNAFMTAEGLFNWVLGPTWKSDAMLAAPKVLQEFTQLGIADTLSWDENTRQYVTRPQTVLSEMADGSLYGAALSYPTGYPWTFTGCAVRAYVQSPKLMRVDNADHAADPSYFHVEVMTFTHTVLAQEVPDNPAPDDVTFFSHPDVLAPTELWKQLEKRRENDAYIDVKHHSYPWLITYPFDLGLAQMSAPGANRAVELTCDELWYQRNLIFHQNGYCFQGARGQSTFGNDGCHADAQTISLTPKEKTAVADFKRQEKEKGC